MTPLQSWAVMLLALALPLTILRALYLLARRPR